MNHPSSHYAGYAGMSPGFYSMVERRPARRRVLGLDLGKAVDFTALTVVDWTDATAAVPKPVYTVPALKRRPLGTKYTEVAAWLVRFFQQPDSSRKNEPAPYLVVDETGVGAPVVEMIREALIQASAPGGMIAVTITAGSAMTNHAHGRWRVAKKQLASTLLTLLESRRIHVNRRMPLADLLIKEAQGFSVKITPAGNETFESWRDSEHDDLVLSLALACWAAETISFGGEITCGERGVIANVPWEQDYPRSRDREDRAWWEKL